jgi:hypothetical protein
VAAGGATANEYDSVQPLAALKELVLRGEEMVRCGNLGLRGVAEDCGDQDEGELELHPVVRIAVFRRSRRQEYSTTQGAPVAIRVASVFNL